MGKHILVAFVALALSCSNDPEVGNNSPSPEPDAGVDDASTPDVAPDTDWGTGLSYHGDIEPLVQDNCMPCHTDGGVAPFDLTNVETIIELAPLIKSAIETRTMPPWGVDNSGTCNTYQDARWLSDEEIETFSEWLDGDHNLGNPEWAPEPFVPAAPLPRVDATLDIGVDYAPANQPDDYRCFVVDPGLTERKFITGFHVKPGNLETVHHVVLWDMVDDENIAFVEALDAADPEPGYECFGGPGTAGFSLYAGWAPGSPPTVFPEGTGLELPAGRKLVVQMHYNTAQNSEPDRTTIDLMLEDGVSSQTLQVLFANTKMALPGGETDAEAVFDIQPRQLGAPFAISIHGVFPHMHGKGTSMTVSHITEEGATCAVDVPRWDFNWQQMYFFEKPLLLEPDDLLRLSCKYDLSAETGMVPWGEGTDDEMCVAAFYATLGPFPESVRPDEVADPIEIPVSEPDTSGVSHGWSKRIGGSSGDRLGQMTMDAQSNLWIAGGINGGMVDVDGTTLEAGDLEALLVKYGPDDTLTWARTYPSAGANEWSMVTSDRQGGAFVGGSYRNAWDLGGTVHPAAPGDTSDAVIARVDANGDVLWSHSVGGDNWDWMGWEGATTDSAGNLVASGFVSGVVDVLGTTIGVAERGTRFMIKVAPDGTVVWVQPICTTDNWCHFLPAVGPNDDIIAAGYVSGTTQFLGGSEHVVRNLENEGLERFEDAFAMGVAADGTLQWVQTYGGELTDGFGQPQFDATGNVYVTGWMMGAVDLGAGAVEFSGASDAVVAQLNPTSGDVIWSKSLGGVGSDGAGAFGFDSAGNLIIGVAFEAWADFGGGLHVSEGRSDLAIVSLTNTGEFLWAKSVGGRGQEKQPRLAVGANDIYFGFFSAFGLSIGGEDLPAAGGDDIVLTKYTLP